MDCLLEYLDSICFDKLDIVVNILEPYYDFKPLQEPLVQLFLRISIIVPSNVGLKSHPFSFCLLIVWAFYKLDSSYNLVDLYLGSYLEKHRLERLKFLEINYHGSIKLCFIMLLKHFKTGLACELNLLRSSLIVRTMSQLISTH